MEPARKVISDIMPWSKSWEELLASKGIDPAEHERRMQIEAERERQHAYRTRLRASGALVKPEMAIAIVSGTLEQTQSVVVVQAWLDVAHGRIVRRDGRRPCVLVLSGSIGVGKTVAAAWALAMEGGDYTTADELPERMFPGRYRRYEAKPFGGAVAVVDDVGTEESKDFGAALLKLIDVRMHRARSLTILTSNLSKAQWTRRYDLRLMDRLEEAGAFVEFEEQSMRRSAR
jgi:hypothetical protein